ncbi:MAG TPA: 1,4-dihydroxy-2-naphthoate polyprenyltransferase [Acidobacteriota bacterium]|nr:1,4-dihydroxy-2-naphthoate polyprenyltransferase [Acidobacteriota bacterium]
MPQKPGATKWILAARPKTLWASVAPVIVGTAVAWRDGMLHWPAAVACLAGAVLIQIGTNFANDLFDYERGVDTSARTGPLRVTQAGLVTPEQMRAAMVVVFSFAFAVGVFLVWRGGWPIVAVGLASIAAAILYTGGPFPYGYRGLGDLFVFVFFGPVAVAGTYYVQALEVTTAVWAASLPMGFLATAILVVNNLRDIDTDRQTGKKTLAVRLGRTGSTWEYALLLTASLLVPIVMVVCDMAGIGVLAAAAAMLIGIPDIMTLARQTDGARLNQTLARTARLQAVYAIVFAIGINL